MQVAAIRASVISRVVRMGLRQILSFIPGRGRCVRQSYCSLTVERTRLSTKGQIILPKAIRDARAWGPGTEFTVEASEDGVLLRPARRLPPTTLDDVVGCLRPGNKRKLKTEAQIKDAIEQQIRRRHGSGRY